MSAERPDFIDAYNAVEVPDPMVTQDASDSYVSDTVNAYFEAVQNSLGLGARSLGGFFEYDYKMLAPLIRSGREYPDTNDFIQIFRKKGYQVLAAVTYMRDDFNAQITQFAKYPLLDPTITTIRELQHLERIEDGLE